MLRLRGHVALVAAIQLWTAVGCSQEAPPAPQLSSATAARLPVAPPAPPTARASAPPSAATTAGVAPHSHEGMVHIRAAKPPTCIWLGDSGEPDCVSATTAVRQFFLDETEVSIGAYQRCVQAGACATQGLMSKPACIWRRRNDEEARDTALNCTSREQAEDFCAWSGKRLPTAAEWQVAAAAAFAEAFPWGANRDGPPPTGGATFAGPPNPTQRAEALGFCWRKLEPCTVRFGPRGANGLIGIVGNVREWVATPAQDDSRLMRNINPEVAQLGWGITFGTGWFDPDLDDPSLLAVRRVDIEQASRHRPAVGFRCAKDYDTP